MLTNVTIGKQEGYSPCNTSVHNTSGTKFFKELQNKCIIRFLKRKKIYKKRKKNTMKTHFIKPTQKEEKKFSHYLVSVKNRNSPVTFTLHFLIIYIYVHQFLLIICHCPLCLINSLQKRENCNQMHIFF